MEIKEITTLQIEGVDRSFVSKQEAEAFVAVNELQELMEAYVRSRKAYTEGSEKAFQKDVDAVTELLVASEAIASGCTHDYLARFAPKTYTPRKKRAASKRTTTKK